MSSVVGVESALDRSNKQLERQNELFKDAASLIKSSNKSYSQFVKDSRSLLNSQQDPYEHLQGGLAHIEKLQGRKKASEDALEDDPAYQRLKSLEAGIKREERDVAEYAAATGRTPEELAKSTIHQQMLDEYEKLKKALDPAIANISKMEKTIQELDAEYRKESDGIYEGKRLSEDMEENSVRESKVAAERYRRDEETKRKVETERRKAEEERNKEETRARSIIEHNDPLARIQREAQEVEDLHRKGRLTKDQRDAEFSRLRKPHEGNENQPRKRPEFVGFEEMARRIQQAVMPDENKKHTDLLGKIDAKLGEIRDKPPAPATMG
jgi:hypothetical protein